MAHTAFQNPIGLPFIELQSVDSTNNYALAQVNAGLALHGTAFFAWEQVAGKGQRGKSWTAEKESSLLLSVVINPHPIPLTRQFELSACIAVAVHSFFNQYAGDATRIKWPNDLYWHDRKAGGVLIENIVSNQQPAKWTWSVIGIGININQPAFPAPLQKAVSLRQITGKTADPVNLAKELCASLDKYFGLLHCNGFEEIYRLYLSNLYKKDQPVRFKKGTRVFEAIVKSVSPVGQLIVQHAMEEEFAFGEVEWLIPDIP